MPKQAKHRPVYDLQRSWVSGQVLDPGLPEGLRLRRACSARAGWHAVDAIKLRCQAYQEVSLGRGCPRPGPRAQVAGLHCADALALPAADPEPKGRLRSPGSTRGCRAQGRPCFARPAVAVVASPHRRQAVTRWLPRSGLPEAEGNSKTALRAQSNSNTKCAWRLAGALGPARYPLENGTASAEPWGELGPRSCCYSPPALPRPQGFGSSSAMPTVAPSPVASKAPRTQSPGRAADSGSSLGPLFARAGQSADLVGAGAMPRWPLALGGLLAGARPPGYQRAWPAFKRPSASLAAVQRPGPKLGGQS